MASVSCARSAASWPAIPRPRTDFREVSSPLTAEMLRPSRNRPRRRPVPQPPERRRLRAGWRVVPRVPGDDAPRLRLLRPLDHRSRVPADSSGHACGGSAPTRLWDSLTSLDGLRHRCLEEPRGAGDRSHERPGSSSRGRSRFASTACGWLFLEAGRDDSAWASMLGGLAGWTTSRCARSRCTDLSLDASCRNARRPAVASRPQARAARAIVGLLPKVGDARYRRALA